MCSTADGVDGVAFVDGVEGIDGGVAVDRLERMLVRAQHLTSGPIDTTLEEIVMDTADIRNYKQNNNLLKGKMNYLYRKSRNLSSSPSVPIGA